MVWLEEHESYKIFSLYKSGKNSNYNIENSWGIRRIPGASCCDRRGRHGSVVIDIIEKLPQLTLVGILDSKLTPARALWITKSWVRRNQFKQ